MRNRTTQESDQTLKTQESGFTLLEVIITLTILVSMVYAVSLLMRSSFDVRISLAQDATITHRLNTAMQRLTYDISHAFIIDTRNIARSDINRRTVFRLERGEKGDKLFLTYVGHRQRQANTKEADLAYVVYEVRRSKEGKDSTRTHLYRGEYPRIPENSKKVEDPPMELFVPNVESIKIEGWQGDDWSKEQWDSTSRDTNNFLPHMVRITVRAWMEDPVEGAPPPDDSSDQMIRQLTAVTTIPLAIDFNELKSRSSSFDLKATQ